MEEIKVFENQEFGKVRTAEIDGKPYFMASDIAKALGYARPNDAVSAHCRAAVKHSTPISGKMQEVNFIPEGDIYRLIAHSKLPTAERFESWVFDEVLPTIRKHGAYMTEATLEKALTSPDFLIQLATQLKKEQEEKAALQEENDRMKPKAEFFDAVTDSRDAIDMGKVAKVLNYPGIGRNRLFEILRDEGILMKNNEPYQKYIDNGCFRTIEQKYSMPDGSTRINIKTLVFQKGIDFIKKVLDIVS